MNSSAVFVWNVRGLNMRARRRVVPCAFRLLLFAGSGGVGRHFGCTAKGRLRSVEQSHVQFSVTVHLAPASRPDTSWWLTTVYGPVIVADKERWLHQSMSIGGPYVAAGLRHADTARCMVIMEGAEP